MFAPLDLMTGLAISVTVAAAMASHDRMLGGERAPLPLESIVFATTDDDVPVGVANASLYDSEEGRCAELGWVAVRPEHRGHGLAYEICRGVLQFSRASRHRYVFLKTEDFRVAAIKTYLRLGFEPEVKPDQVNAIRRRARPWCCGSFRRRPCATLPRDACPRRTSIRCGRFGAIEVIQ